MLCDPDDRASCDKCGTGHVAGQLQTIGLVHEDIEVCEHCADSIVNLLIGNVANATPPPPPTTARCARCGAEHAPVAMPPLGPGLVGYPICAGCTAGLGALLIGPVTLTIDPPPDTD